MQALSVYTTPQLNEETFFINSFLDDLLEQYCSKHFVENTPVPSNFVFPNLNTLICHSYPNFYQKDIGLYCNRVTTEVIVVYKTELHETLLSALEHKLSRLFIPFNAAVQKLIISKDTLRNIYLTPNSNLISRFSRRSLNKVSRTEIQSILKCLSIDKHLSVLSDNSSLIYKPSVDIFIDFSQEVYKHNEDLINSLNFFDSSKLSNLIIRISDTILSDSTLTDSSQLSRYFSKDFYTKMSKRASFVMEELYLEVDLIKSSVMNRERELRQSELHLEQDMINLEHELYRRDEPMIIPIDVSPKRDAYYGAIYIPKSNTQDVTDIDVDSSPKNIQAIAIVAIILLFLITISWIFFN